MANLITKAEAVVGVDTGLTHLSAALGIKTICLFGSTNQQLTAALGKRSLNLHSNYPCSPCQLKRCQFSSVGMSDDDRPFFPPCYEQLSAQLVWQSLDKFSNIR